MKDGQMKLNPGKCISILLLSILFASVFAGCQGQTSSPGLTREIAVFAGSASKPPLDEAAKVFEKQTGIKVYLTYGGSGTVLSQMELSKSGDVYVPGSPDYLIKAINKKIVDPDTTRIVAYLIPAIAVQKGNPKNILNLSDLAIPGIKVGIGNPTSVCVGLYAIEILDYNHLLAEVNKNIVTQAASCDATAALISLKLEGIDAVMGWDVFHSWNPDKIDVIYLKPEQTPRIAYIPAAISTYTKDKASSAAFVEFMVSDSAKVIFKKWGYNVNEAEARQFAPDAKVGGEYQVPDSYKALIK
jgi:molybdate transport system substrate-binding protein